MDIDVALVRFSILSAMLGFVAFCVIQGAHIWWSRNRRVAAEAGNSASWVVWVACLTMVSGACLMGMAVPLREILPLEGELTGRNLLAVRVPAESRADFLTTATRVHKGDVIARFSSPRWDGELRAQRSRVDGLKALRASLEIAPATLDPELVRRSQNVTQERRQLDTTIQWILPAHASLMRELLHTSITQKEQAVRVAGALAEVAEERQREEIQRQFSERQQTRTAVLANSRLASVREREADTKNARVHAIEERRLAQRADHLREEQGRVAAGMTEMERLAVEQKRMLEAELAKIRTEQSALRQQELDHERMLATEAVRAAERRALAVRELEARIAEAEAVLVSLEARAEYRSPCDGVVAYAHAAPQLAPEKSAVLILGPESGCRLNVRLSAEQAAAMRAGDGGLEVLVAGMGHRFPARLAAEREVGLARQVGIDCQPSPDVFERLGAGERLTGRLLWRPPLTTTWAFIFGAVLFGIGLVARLIALAFEPGEAKASASVPAATGVAQGVPAAPAAGTTTVPGALDLELGAVGSQLRVLGTNLRQSILHHDVRPELLGAIEWALDRHQCRAIRSLNAGLGDLTVDDVRVQSLVSGREGERLSRILKALQPELAESVFLAEPTLEV